MQIRSYQCNKRTSERRKPRTTVRVECRKGSLGLGRNIGERMLDFSESGACLVVKIQLQVNEEVEIQIHRDGPGQPIKKLATVRWVVATDDDHYCVGLELQSRIPYSEIQRLARPGSA